MYCLTPDLNRCFRLCYRFICLKHTFRSTLLKLLVILALLFLIGYQHHRFDSANSHKEAPFCNVKFPSFVTSPPRFGPGTQSGRIGTTPQNTSGVWVVYNYLSPTKPTKNNFVTLTTHVTSNFLTPELTDLVNNCMGLGSQVCLFLFNYCF
jgi:hypothetical protein